MDNIKPLPHNPDAEKALIADIFQKNDIMIDTIGILKITDFYSKSNQMIYSKLLDLYKKDITIDIITFANSIDKDKLISMGGITELTHIVASEISTSNYKQYIKIIKELSDKRAVIKSCQKALNIAYDDEIEAHDIMCQVETDFLGMGEIERIQTVNMESLMFTTLEMIEKSNKAGGKILGISTGYAPIDKATNGFVKGDLMVIAARPSMGKTALILNMLNKLQKESKALLCELEMSEEKIGIRLLAAKSLFQAQLLTRGQIKSEDFELLGSKCNEIATKNNIYVNCRSNPTVSEIRAEAKKIKLRNGLDVLVVDHIGKIKPDNFRASRNDQISQITQGLKDIARDLNVCVVALSQLNRAVETRNDKHPNLSDLRDSGSIEQDADEVLMLYREDYYAERENRISNKPNVLEIMVAKNRDGEAGMIELNYNTNYQLITEISRM